MSSANQVSPSKSDHDSQSTLYRRLASENPLLTQAQEIAYFLKIEELVHGFIELAIKTQSGWRAVCTLLSFPDQEKSKRRVPSLEQREILLRLSSVANFRRPSKAEHTELINLAKQLHLRLDFVFTHSLKKQPFTTPYDALSIIATKSAAFTDRLTELEWVTESEFRQLFAEANRILEQVHSIKDTIALHNLALVIRETSIWYSKGGRKGDWNSLESECSLGLAWAIDRFDPRRLKEDNEPYKFSTVAVHWIRQKLQKGTSGETIRVPKGRQAEMKKLFAAQERLRKETKYEPTAEDLASETGIPVKKVSALLLESIQMISLDAKVTVTENSSTLYEMLPATEQLTTQEQMQKEEDTISVRAALDSLPAEERDLLKLRFDIDSNAATQSSIRRTTALARSKIREITRRANKLKTVPPRIVILG